MEEPAAEPEEEPKAAEPAYLDGGLLLLTLSRPSFGIGKNKLNTVLNSKEDLVPERKMSGEEEMSQADTVNLLLACAEADPIFYKSLHRRLPRMRKKRWTVNVSVAPQTRFLVVAKRCIS